MCRNYPYQLGALTSDSFSERMISASSVLVDTHRIRLDHDIIDKMVALRINKRYMERARFKEALTSIVFHDVFSDEFVSANEEWMH